jgi:hypothetical protein
MRLPANIAANEGFGVIGIFRQLPGLDSRLSQKFGQLVAFRSQRKNAHRQ